jgi:hypothetical protein
MAQLAGQIAAAIVELFGIQELLRRLSDPFWFQALGCVLGYDWHSSGVTTTVCGALKEGIRGKERDLGLFVAGGKGRVSRNTPLEIERFAETLSFDPSPLVYASRMAAKVDNSALQDGYQLYHHTFFFSSQGLWAIVQQGMNPTTRYARRYHWLGERVKNFVCEPHHAICSQGRGEGLNLVAEESEEARKTIAQLSAEEKPHKLVRELERLKTLNLPHRHHLLLEDIHPQRLDKILLSAYERQPKDFEHLLGIEGVGPKTLRALSLIAEIIYGTPLSFRDPARYSFAHGGKDRHPYPIDKETYDRSIAILSQAIHKAKLSPGEKRDAFLRLSPWVERR